MNGPQRFRTRPVDVEAWQVTETNMHDVAEWCGGKVASLNRKDHGASHYLYVPGHGGCVLPGDWVTRHPDSSRFRVSVGDTAFAARYEPVSADV